MIRALINGFLIFLKLIFIENKTSKPACVEINSSMPPTHGDGCDVLIYWHDVIAGFFMISTNLFFED